MTWETLITEKFSGQPSVSNDNMDNICQSVMLFEKVTKKLSHQNKDFITLSMSCICLRSLIWYNFSTADGLHISLDYTDVLDNGDFTDKAWFHLTYLHTCSHGFTLVDIMPLTAKH